MIKYKEYKNISNEHFNNSLNENLANNTEIDYYSFEEIVPRHHLKKVLRANQRVFMNKEIHKAIR